MKITFEISAEELANLVFGLETDTTRSSSTSGSTDENYPCDVCDRPCEETGECPYNIDELYEGCPCDVCDRVCEEIDECPYYCNNPNCDLCFENPVDDGPEGIGVEPRGFGIFAGFSTLPFWSLDANENLCELLDFESFFNTLLALDGKLKLVTVLRHMGYDIAKETRKMTRDEYDTFMRLGWTRGDYVDFGLHKNINKGFPSADHNWAILDFNVTGEIN